jgi:hypothetical protein
VIGLWPDGQAGAVAATLLGYPRREQAASGTSHVMIHPKMTPSGIVDELGRFAADVGTLVSRVG